MKKLNVIAVALLMAGVLAVCTGLVLKYHGENKAAGRINAQQYPDTIPAEAEDPVQGNGGD